MDIDIDIEKYLSVFFPNSNISKYSIEFFLWLKENSELLNVIINKTPQYD